MRTGVVRLDMEFPLRGRHEMNVGLRREQILRGFLADGCLVLTKEMPRKLSRGLEEGLVNWMDGVEICFCAGEMR